MILVHSLLPVLSLLSKLTLAAPPPTRVLAPRQDSGPSYPGTSATPSPSPTPTPACSYDNPIGLIQPKDGDILYFDPVNYNLLEFEILYCSGEYFKTRSISGDVWWNRVGVRDDGQILALQQKPDNKDAGISSSYRFNVTVYGNSDGIGDGDEREVAFYEAATGYVYAYGYNVYRAKVILKPKPTDPAALRTRVSATNPYGARWS